MYRPQGPFGWMAVAVTLCVGAALLTTTAAAETADPPSPLVAAYVNGTFAIDGRLNEAVWSDANAYPIVFTSANSTKTATVYLAHDETYLYVGLDTPLSTGWDSYSDLNVDGNHDGVITPDGTTPTPDFRAARGAPGAWGGYTFWWRGTTPPNDPPQGYASASAVVQGVDYEYRLPIGAFASSLDATVGILLMIQPVANKNNQFLYPLTDDILDSDPNWMSPYADVPGWADLVFESSNTPPIANAGADVVEECTNTSGATVTLDGTGSSDADGDALAYEWAVPAGSGAVLDDPTSAEPTGTFPLGLTLVTLTVTDGNGGMSMDDVLVTVQDTTPPLLVCTTDRIALWPPKHDMVQVNIQLLVSDACSSPSTMYVECTVESSEPDDADGDGASTGDVDGEDGYIAPVDVELVYDSDSGAYLGSVALRAERDGANQGRVYSIVCEVADVSGNTGTASCVVVVPHDKRKK